MRINTNLKKKKWGLEQSPSINRNRDRGVQESGGYRLGHCTSAYRVELIMGAQKKLTQDY